MDKLIRYKDRKFFFSKDNWKNFDVLKSFVNSAAEEEQNSDVVVSVRLRYELGEKRAKVILEELEKIRKRFNLPQKDGYGHAFEIFAISILYNIDYTVAYDNYIVKGNRDGKIDAVYWKSDDKVEIYQIKLDFLDENDINIMRFNHNEFCRTQKISYPNSIDLQNFYVAHSSNITSRKKLIIKLISNNSKFAGNILPMNIFEMYFENQLLKKNNNIELLLNIPASENNLAIMPDKSIFVYFDKAKNFIDSIISCEQIRITDNLYKLFYDNVRGQLVSNQNMYDTLINEPENFVKYNNGITITGDVEYYKDNESIIIKNPVISNGQQTIWNVIKNYSKLNDTNFLIIVKNVKDSTIKSKIARFTNEQTNIKPIDLLSLNEGIRTLQKDLYYRTEFFLEINNLGTKNYTKLIEEIYNAENIIKLKDFCRVYYSFCDRKIGDWKNIVSKKIEELLGKNLIYDLELAIEVCKTIKRYNIFIGTIDDEKEKNNLKNADLAFMYIMLKYEKNERETLSIINQMNKDFFFDKPLGERKSKLIDLYKSNDIVEIIESYFK